jgi:predicted  nucleic acid-binding Zn-ribbon protein
MKERDANGRELNDLRAKFHEYRSAHDGLSAQVHSIQDRLKDSESARASSADELRACQHELQAAQAAEQDKAAEAAQLRAQLKSVRETSVWELQELRRCSQRQLDQARCELEGRIVVEKEIARQRVETAEANCINSAAELKEALAALERERTQVKDLQQGAR